MSTQTNGRDLNVAVLIAARNEEARIADCIKAVMNQTHPPVIVLVVADNCTDNTFEVAAALTKTYEMLRVERTQNNHHRKAGALNQGYRMLLEYSVDYIVQIDADTTIEPDTFEKGLALLEGNPSLGGVCPRFSLIPTAQSAGLLAKTLWKLQNLEFGFKEVSIIQSEGKNTLLLSGRCTIFRAQALEDIQTSGPWPDSKVEDHAITVQLRKKGWGALTGKNMHGQTEAPETLWKFIVQRIRWYEGTSTLLIDERFGTPVAKETRGTLMGFLWIIARLYFLSAFLLLALGVFEYEFNLVIALVFLAIFGYSLHKLFYMRRIDVWQFLMVATYFPFELYLALNDSLLITGWVTSLTGKVKARVIRTRESLVISPNEEA